MPQPRYLPLEDLLCLIDEPNRTSCRRLLADNMELFRTVQGSTNNHQAWPGGYFDHVHEVLNIAVALYALFAELRPLPFSLSDALLVLYLHDVEKPWKYELGPDGQLHHLPSQRTKADQHAFRLRKLAEYGIELTADQHNGLKYVEGEHDDYSSRQRVSGPLAAFCHLCDTASARIWFAHPAVTDDPWAGAGRGKF